MIIRPDKLEVDGTTIYAKIGNLKMPLSEEMIREHCGHLPKSEGRAWAMAERLKGRPLEFPNNISLGNRRRKIKTLTGWRDGPEKRRERIERRKRRERGVVKVTLTIVLEEGYDKKRVLMQIGTKLLTLEGLKPNPIKTSATNQIILDFERKIKQGEFYEKIYPKIIELLDEEVKEFTGISFMD